MTRLKPETSMRTIDKGKILIVDDEEDILKVVGKRLDKAGYNVIVASGGKQALAVLEREIPSLILLDIVMPGMDGIELCDKIKKRKSVSNVPIIFFTARNSISDKMRGLNRGVNDYITKPIDHRELLARIKAVLKINKHYNEISLKDELTGLYNYNFFEKRFSYVFNIARRYGRVFSLIMIDINNFKAINDRYGHLCGNLVLKKISQKLRSSLRKTDIVVRCGGDEFVLILSETNHIKAGEVLEKLRKTIGKIQLTHKRHKIDVGLSFGLATYSEEIKTKNNLFNIADRNMYKDKRRSGS